MVAHVLRLRLALLIGSLRSERAARTGLGFALVVGGTAVVAAAILSLADAPAAVARTVIVLGFAVVLLAFLLGPILIGATDQLDPRRFIVFGVDERRMPWILALASLVSVPSFAVLALGVCTTIVETRLGTPWPLAVLAGVVGLVSVAIAARIGMALNALLLPEWRSRELTTLFALALIVVGFPVAVFFASLEWDEEVPAVVSGITDVVGFTPFAAVHAFPFEIAAGRTMAAWIAGAVAVLTLAALLVVWVRLVRRLLTAADRPVTVRERSGLGWFALLPSNPLGAIAARSLVYWLRDRRYLVNVLVVPVAGVLTVPPLLVAGVPVEIAALVPVPVMALFFGWLPHNDVAYDSTAFWMHVAGGVRGFADRIGRLAPIVLVAVPVLAVAVPLTLSTVGSWYLTMPLIGLAACLFLGALGLSSISSVVSPYAVSRPGDSPFEQPQRSASRGGFGPAGVFVGALVLAVPTLWLFVLAVQDVLAYGAAAFWAGLGTGVVVLVGGVLGGAFIFDHGGEERLMEFVETA